MKNKKQRKNPHQIKLEQAFQKNNYFKKLREIMNLIGSGSALDLLDPCDIETIYHVRLRSLHFKCEGEFGTTLKNKELKFCSSEVNRALRNKFVYLANETVCISLYDFYTYVESIYLIWRNCLEMEFQNGKKFHECFPVFLNDYTEKRISFFEEINTTIEGFSWTLCDILKRWVWVEQEKSDKCLMEQGLSAFQNIYIIHTVKPTSEIIEIDGYRRTIFRLGLPRFSEREIHWVTLNREVFALQNPGYHILFDVYIQVHVIERMKERIGKYFSPIYFLMILSAVLSTEPIPDGENSILFPVLLMDIKVGYLKGNLIEDKLILRTFLFLTNNGTPEGKKLAELFGLQKQDKKFLAIDKLDAFIKSDLLWNENLKKLFSMAGCGELFEIRDKLRDEIAVTMHCADYLSKYLGVEMKSEVDAV